MEPKIEELKTSSYSLVCVPQSEKAYYNEVILINRFIFIVDM